MLAPRTRKQQRREIFVHGFMARFLERGPTKKYEVMVVLDKKISFGPFFLSSIISSDEKCAIGIAGGEKQGVIDELVGAFHRQSMERRYSMIRAREK